MQKITVVGKKLTRILPMIPSSCASTSITALSVSCMVEERSSEIIHRNSSLSVTYNLEQHVTGSKAVTLAFLP